MFIRLVDGAAAPYTIAQLKADNQNTSFPDNINESLLAEFSVFPVKWGEKPAYDYLTERCVEGDYLQDEIGNWVQNYLIVSFEQSIAEENVRKRRNKLLQETDWMALNDNTMSPAWASYRQALRDVTSQEGFPFSVTWPTMPE